MKIEMRIIYILMTRSRARCAQCNLECTEIPPEMLWTRENAGEMATRTHGARAAAAAAKCEKTALRTKYETLRLIVDKHRKYAPAVMDEVHEIEKANGQELIAYIMQHVKKLGIVYVSQ
jgi:hypothetical protein